MIRLEDVLCLQKTSSRRLQDVESRQQICNIYVDVESRQQICNIYISFCLADHAHTHLIIYFGENDTIFSYFLLSILDKHNIFVFSNIHCRFFFPTIGGLDLFHYVSENMVYGNNNIEIR